MNHRIRKALKWSTFALIVLLSACIGFYLSRQMRPRKSCRIVAVYPLGPHDKGYGNVRALVAEQLDELGFNAEIKEIYLQCGHISEEESATVLDERLEELEGWNPNLIIVKGDNALEFVLQSSHKMLYTKPVIFHNVHFIDIEKLQNRPNFSGYWDKLEYWENMLFVKQLLGDVDIDINYSRSRMGLIRHKWMMADLEGKKVDISLASMKREDYEDSVYLDSSIVRSCPDAEVRLKVVPIPNMTGKGLIDHFKSHNQNAHMAFLIGKFEYSTHIVANYYHLPLFTTLSEGFNEDMKIVGGYFTDEQTLVKEWVGQISKTLEAGHYLKQMIIKSEKAWHVDYKMMNFWNLDESLLPSGVQMHNVPLYARWHYVVKILFFILILFLAYSLYYLSFVRRKTLQEMEKAASVQRNVDAILYSLEQGNIISWHIEEEGIIHLDSSHRKFSGLEKDDFTYEEFGQLLHDEDRDRVLQTLKHIYENTSTCRMETRILQQNKPVWFALTYSIIDNPDGMGKIVCGIMENIEGRKQQERELIESRKMAEEAEKKQSFLENVNHEIRTPLNVIVGFSSIICNDLDNELDEAVKKEYVEAINSNNERLLALIRDILEISRIDSGYTQFHYEKVPLLDILCSVESEEKGFIPSGVRLVVVKEGLEDISLRVDRMRLRQALHCLLSNAGKFTTTGMVAINSWVDPVNKEVCIAVMDTGVGIPSQQLRMIFTRFYKGDAFASGTGLGLSICELIVRSMKGRITAKSVEGEGSTFTMIFPLAE